MYNITPKFPPPKQRQTYPFKFMHIGESIFVPFPHATSARVSAYNFSRRHKITFSSQLSHHKAQLGIRIWRTA